MMRSIKITALLFLLSLPAYSQVISVFGEENKLPGKEVSGVISNLEDENAPQQEQFLDWNSTLGNFSEIITVTQKEILTKIDALNAKQTPKEKYITFKGKKLNLPSNIDENGTDLYMLTDEGITIYMALLAPAFYQETTADIIKWIRYYAYDKRNQTKKMFKRYERWETHIKNVFYEYNVPTEIAELCLIESACTYSATSTVGAKGMWQIMPETAKSWGLIVTDEIDERTDPVIATRTAAKILSKSYETIRDWTMVIAAYNCGIGRVTRITRTNGTNDWLRIKNYFPKETQQYIPSLLAIHYVWNYRSQLGLLELE